MALWHRSRRADLALRTVGLLFCGAAWVAIAQLVTRLAVPGRAPDAAAYALAALGFAAASSGTTLTALGRRLFDPVDMGERWRAASHHAFCPPSETIMALDPTDPTQGLPEQDSDGNWTVRDATGTRLRRFPSAEAAQRFALAVYQEAKPAPAPSTPLSRIPGRLSLRIGSAGGERAGA